MYTIAAEGVKFWSVSSSLRFVAKDGVNFCDKSFLSSLIPYRLADLVKKKRVYFQSPQTTNSGSQGGQRR